MSDVKKGELTLGKRIRALRKWLRLSQESIGKYLEIPRSAVSAIEANNRDVTADEVLALSRLFRCDPNSILGLRPTPVDYSGLKFQARVNKLDVELDEHDLKELQNFSRSLEERYGSGEIPKRVLPENLAKSKNPIVAADEVRKKVKSELPVDIFSIIEAIGIYPRFTALSGLAGAIIRKDLSGGDVYGILVNSDQSEERMRFSMAHECAHYVLGHLQKEETYHPSPMARWKSPIETDADTFAAELLMPKMFIHNELKKDSDINALSVLELADLFLVSYQAMNRRLLDLGFISQVEYGAYSDERPIDLRQKLEKGKKKKSKTFDPKILKKLVESKFQLNDRFVNSPDYVRFVQEAACFEYWKSCTINERDTEIKEVYDTVALWMAENVPANL